jgi:hypothetical protein
MVFCTSAAFLQTLKRSAGFCCVLNIDISFHHCHFVSISGGIDALDGGKQAGGWRTTRLGEGTSREDEGKENRGRVHCRSNLRVEDDTRRLKVMIQRLLKGMTRINGK